MPKSTIFDEAGVKLGLGLTPESFSRGITRLVDTGIIHRLGGNTFQILDPERLYMESRKE